MDNPESRSLLIGAQSEGWDDSTTCTQPQMTMTEKAEAFLHRTTVSSNSGEGKTCNKITAVPSIADFFRH